MRQPRHWLICLLLALQAASPAVARAAASPQPPSELFGALFARVQLSGLFADSKTFADAQPLRSPAAILADYQASPPGDDVALRAFVVANFKLPSAPQPASASVRAPAAAATHGAATTGASLPEHIARLWPRLIRPPLAPPAYSSALPLPHAYVVPGGRFREIYYWDSYFTMLGLVRDGYRAIAVDMVDDFAAMLERYGHIPNGARSYYLSRSQPPFFYLMVGLTDADSGAAFARYLPALRREHAFWMAGEDSVGAGESHRRVVRLADGTLLNRYYDDRAAPRDESYREDVALAQGTTRPQAELYRDVRAAAESGWDFSSRWLGDGQHLASIETTAIVPVDLNSLLYGLEQSIASGCRRMLQVHCVMEYTERAARRRIAINHYLWDEGQHRYADLQWRQGVLLPRPSAAMLYPLFTGVADPVRADGVADNVRDLLLAPGGLLATPVRTGQQWDAPNGWAPLQWIAVRGLSAYGHDALAGEVAERWLATVERVYAETGKLLEKYDVQEALPGGGGEYPTQDGFGWTNGVTRALLEEFSAAANPAGRGGS